MLVELAILFRVSAVLVGDETLHEFIEDQSLLLRHAILWMVVTPEVSQRYAILQPDLQHIPEKNSDGSPGVRHETSDVRASICAIQD